MPLLVQRILRGCLPSPLDSQRPPARDAACECIELGVRDGHRPSAKPPVRIFIGTERQQFRAERTLLWSIEAHRDPSRTYHIHLLRDLPGFRRRLWLTGFTNYRFAIPALCNYQGRAIYNDADQVYLTDPAELFDTPMGDAGFLAINDRDTSVMLLDCERLAGVWELRAVRCSSRKVLEARARGAGLWSPLRGTWNTRDREYQHMQADLVHFTTLQTQPWRPFPDQFVYFDNPTGELWAALEAAADRQGFLPINARRPSVEWPATLARLARRSDAAELQTLLAPQPPPCRETLTIDGVLEQVADEDIPWVLERLFRTARRLHLRLDEPLIQRRGSYRRNAWFWLQQMHAASRQHPATAWRLTRRGPRGRSRSIYGGYAGAGPITVLTHRKPGHNHQARAIARGLAEHTGREVHEVPANLSEARFVVQSCFGRRPGVTLPADTRVVVASAWLCCRLARQLARHQPHLRLVLSGRKAGPAAEHGSVLVQCAHFGLPPHPNRLTTTLPLNAGESQVTRDTAPWAQWLNAPQRVALLLGGTSRSHRLNRGDARRLAREVSAWARTLDARLLVVGGRRSERVLDAVAASLGPDDLLYRWQADDPANPYHEALRHAEQLVVTGESESMLADAVSRGRQFLIWPLPRRSASPWRRLSSAIARRAVRVRYNARGSVKPQQGLTYLCARAIERGWILPPRNVEALHQRLFEQNLAAPFGQAADAEFDPGEGLQRTAQQAARRLGLEPAEQPAAGYGMNARLNQGTYVISASATSSTSMNGQLAE